MPHLRIIVEGQSEERIVKDVISPQLAGHDVWATPTMVDKSPSGRSRITKGGGRKYHPYRRDIILTLKQNSEWYVTTMLDLYAIPADFPGVGRAVSSKDRVAALEEAMNDDIRKHLGNVYPWRFIPHIQPYELEAFLFVAPETSASVIRPGDSGYARELRAVRDSFATPEEINDGQHTAPSKRLGQAYRKTVHAPKAISAVGLQTIRSECPHFDRWLGSLERLGSPA